MGTLTIKEAVFAEMERFKEYREAKNQNMLIRRIWMTYDKNIRAESILKAARGFRRVQ